MDDALDEKQQELKELTLKYEQLTGSTTNYEEKLKTEIEPINFITVINFFFIGVSLRSSLSSGL